MKELLSGVSSVARLYRFSLVYKNTIARYSLESYYSPSHKKFPMGKNCMPMRKGVHGHGGAGPHWCQGNWSEHTKEVGSSGTFGHTFKLHSVYTKRDRICTGPTRHGQGGLHRPPRVCSLRNDHAKRRFLSASACPICSLPSRLKSSAADMIVAPRQTRQRRTWTIVRRICGEAKETDNHCLKINTVFPDAIN